MQTENLRVCSTAHFTSEDNELLATMAGQAAFRSWVVNIQYGYILVLTDYRRRLRVLKSQGASKALRRFLIHQINITVQATSILIVMRSFSPVTRFLNGSALIRAVPIEGASLILPARPAGNTFPAPAAPKGRPG